MSYLPEGYHPLTGEEILPTPAAAYEAMYAQTILESRALLCDAGHNLILDLGCMKGIIPREECALGIREGTTRDIAILSRVNKPVCFRILQIRTEERGSPYAVLSRRAVQQECRERYLDSLLPGDIIPGKVTHIEPFGCFVDIGCGIVSLLPIDAISVSRINHPQDRFAVGQNLYAVVRTNPPDHRICLSHRELLGSWAENASRFHPGETVAGVIRSVEHYGIFVELTPNLAGLAECKPGVQVGQQGSVYIKSILPEKMKIKLVIVDAFDAAPARTEFAYTATSGHLDRFCYSPPESEKRVETIFTQTENAVR